MHMKPNPHRFVPQRPQVAAALPADRVPNLVRRPDERVALLRREAFVRLEAGIEKLDADVSIAAVGIDAQRVPFEHELFG